jgi:hypothetical protein
VNAHRRLDNAELPVSRGYEGRNLSLVLAGPPAAVMDAEADGEEVTEVRPSRDYSPTKAGFETVRANRLDGAQARKNSVVAPADVPRPLPTRSRR